jgi:hypothetical protein
MESFDKFCESALNAEIKQYFQNPGNTIFIEPKEKNFESMKIEIDNIPDLM